MVHVCGSTSCHIDTKKFYPNLWLMVFMDRHDGPDAPKTASEVLAWHAYLSARWSREA